MSPKKYIGKFKQQIVVLYNTCSKQISQLEKEYVVAKSTISGWINQLFPINLSENETVTMKEYTAL